jgi:hypothetical protein
MTKAEFEEEMAKWRGLRDAADEAYKTYQMLADAADCKFAFVNRMVEKEHQLYMRGEKA